ncbi:Hypp5164 [Branchiostoma lanceolatum]|nr:Hypp5164 [Branchiostoma lanceolatum]
MESKAKNLGNSDCKESFSHGMSSTEVSSVSILQATSKTSSSEVMRFDRAMNVQRQMVSFTTGDQQTFESVMCDDMEERTGPHPLTASLPNYIKNASGQGSEQGVAVKRSITILDDDEPTKKEGWCRRFWKTMKKTLTPACCRPRRRR